MGLAASMRHSRTQSFGCELLAVVGRHARTTAVSNPVFTTASANVKFHGGPVLRTEIRDRFLWVVCRPCSARPERPLSVALLTLDASRYASGAYRFVRAVPCSPRFRYCIAYSSVTSPATFTNCCDEPHTRDAQASVLAPSMARTKVGVLVIP